MSVTAASPEPYLQIKETSAANFGDESVFNLSGASLKLVTVSAVSASGVVTWGYATSEDPDDAQAGNALTTLTATEDLTGNNATHLVSGTYDTNQSYGNFALVQELQLKNNSTVNANSLKVAAKVQNVGDANLNGAGAMDAAVRVLVVVTGSSDTDDTYGSVGKYVVFAGESASHETTSATIGYANNSVYALAASNIELASVLSSQETLTVKVYVYFDGTDATAKNSTTISTDALKVDLCFYITGGTIAYYTAPAN